MAKITVDEYIVAAEFFQRLARTKANPGGATPGELEELRKAESNDPAEKIDLLEDAGIHMAGYTDAVFHFDDATTKQLVVPEHALVQHPPTGDYQIPDQVEKAYKRKLCNMPPPITNEEFFKIRIGDYCTSHCL